MNEQSNKRRVLGRGLEELFNIDDISYEKIEEKIIETSSKEEVMKIPLNELRVNPYQPRKSFDQESLQELAQSIKEHGIIQPIIVKKSIKGYEIVAGERRYRASLLAGFDTIPAIIRDFSDSEMMEIAILENLQREDLNAIEEALAYKKLMDNLEINQDQVAKKIGKSRSHITNMLGLLRLPDTVKDLVIANKISMGHARVLSKLDDIEKINYIAGEITEKGLSVREVESLTSSNDFVRINKIVRRELKSEYVDLENNLSEFLGTKVKIKNKKIEISFENDNDLNRLLEIINYNK